MTVKIIKTDAGARAVKPDPVRQVEHPIDGIPGFALRVSPRGSKKWTLRYRTLEGKQRRLSIGQYPILTLAAARTEAIKRLGEVTTGADPAHARRVAKIEARSRKLSTIGGLIESYCGDAEKGRHRPNARPKRASSIAVDRYYFERFIRPRFGSLPIEELSRADVQRFLDEIGDASLSTARQCRGVLRQVFNYAIRREIVGKNPAALTSIPAGQSRERVLTDDEVRQIWNAAEAPATVSDLRIARSLCLATTLALVTLQRGGEIVGLHARELDLSTGLWVIPGKRTKNHLTHVVPLSDTAMEIIAEAFDLAGSGRGFLFPAPRDSAKPVGRHSFTRVMRILTRALGIEDATPHDFRRTGSTNLTGERIGVSRFIVSRILNYADSGGAAAVTAVYDRNEYLVEKRRALDAWAALLAEIVSGQERGANVVPLTR